MRYSFLMIFLMISFGCTTIHHKKSEVLQNEPNIKNLESRIKDAKKADLDFLSPSNFEQAEKKLDEAVNLSQRSQDLNAGDKLALEGLNFIEQAFLESSKAKEVLGESLEKKHNAQDAKADVYFKNEFEDLEKKLKKAAKALENQDYSLAVTQNGVLAKGFLDLEIRALKIDVSKSAEQAYEDAIAIGADKLAPQTLSLAKKELSIAKNIIEAEKTNYEKAKFHAQKAEYLSLRAKGLAELAILFKNEKLSKEQIGLWYQDQIEKIFEPYNENISFDVSNSDLITRLKNKTKNTLDYVADLEKRNNQAERKITDLKDKLAESLSENDKIRLEKTQKEENFNEISEIFNKDEAEVLKTQNEIIIRAYGFSFKVGSAEVSSDNFTLLHKIVSAILKYPKSDIVVEGYTDSSGSPTTNQRLSEQRAKNIADFLVKIAMIEPSRVSSLGYGSQKPIASDETKEGRAKNRRIEIIIKNAW